MRPWVGPIDPADYDNPDGNPILDAFGIPLAAYNAVFDFGCGCGRQARQLMLQKSPPRRYVGIDVHERLIDWCRENLTPCDPNFQFLHHDVYSPWFAPATACSLPARSPSAEDGAFSLFIATSVFTHLTKDQTKWDYLGEVSRILTPEGIAYTSWFFFDRATFPCVPEVNSLYTSEKDFAQAVLLTGNGSWRPCEAWGWPSGRPCLPSFRAISGWSCWKGAGPIRSTAFPSARMGPSGSPGRR